MPGRPAFVDELLSRPLPALHPAKLGETSNPPYSAALASQIADSLVHPLLESTLHLMNDDLFSAHFLVRKMQEDVMGKWLHGILHKLEGDYANAKCWYRDLPVHVLSLYFTSVDPHREAFAYLDQVALLSAKSVEWCRKTSEIAEITDQCDLPPAPEHLDEQAVRQQAWKELVCLLEKLEADHGWAQVDGSQAYTADGADLSAKKGGMLLGEGWRQF